MSTTHQAYTELTKTLASVTEERDSLAKQLASVTQEKAALTMEKSILATQLSQCIAVVNSSATLSCTRNTPVDQALVAASLSLVALRYVQPPEWRSLPQSHMPGGQPPHQVPSRTGNICSTAFSM